LTSCLLENDAVMAFPVKDDLMEAEAVLFRLLAGICLEEWHGNS
jgi:hypothetical protein